MSLNTCQALVVMVPCAYDITRPAGQAPHHCTRKTVLMNYNLREPKRIPLRIVVANVIRNAIIEGELRPGAKIPEAELAQELGVSRTPVREAVRILEQQGLVKSRPTDGTYIAALDREEAYDSLSVRAALEQLALQQAMDRMGLEEWDGLCTELKGLLDRMSEAVSRGDSVAITELDIEWHTLLIDAARNECLSRTWRSAGLAFLVWTQEREVFPYDQEHLAVIRDRHRELLAVLCAREPHIAEMIRDHLFIKFDDLRDLQRSPATAEAQTANN